MKTFIILCLLALASAAPQHHIVGGDEAKEGAWPWQLALYRSGRFHCGASIISPTSAVTAAHCIVGDANKFEIIAGTNEKTFDCSNGLCVKRRLSEAIQHPNYVESSYLGYPNDIGLIKWDEPIKEMSGKVNIQFINRTTNTNELGKTCFISGWGSIYGGGPSPVKLREAQIDTMTNKECSKTWENLNKGHICLQDKIFKGKGACHGDSGGPLVCEFMPNKYELVGATSWGNGRCNTKYPSVYSRITHFNKWLDSVSL